MRFPVVINFPKVFGWADLGFMERLKLLALLFQAGAGIVMTIFAGYALYVLAVLKATWPVFYLGAGALVLLGIITTGLAGLLITRNVLVEGPGGFKFSSQDQKGAETIAAAIQQTQDTK